ncbi:MAG: hypothetical protein QOJ42_3202 [Acidobacteriaceae bacterium]|jgi:hypothetical protein|nr:hypothetical protein [Acidobacteriaceae bacterium]
MENRSTYPDGAIGPFKYLHGCGHYHETLELKNGNWPTEILILRRTILNII